MSSPTDPTWCAREMFTSWLVCFALPLPCNATQCQCHYLHLAPLTCMQSLEEQVCLLCRTVSFAAHGLSSVASSQIYYIEPLHPTGVQRTRPSTSTRMRIGLDCASVCLPPSLRFALKHLTFPVQLAEIIPPSDLHIFVSFVLPSFSVLISTT